MNQRFFAEFLALLAKRAMEPHTPIIIGNNLDEKPPKMPRADGFDFEEDIIDETMTVEARDLFDSRPSVTLNSHPELFPNAPYRSSSGQHLSAEERVKTKKKF